MIKKLVIIGLVYYVYRQSQQRGIGFVDATTQDIQSLLNQIQQMNPPQPVGDAPSPVFPNPLTSRTKTGGFSTFSGGYRIVK